MSRLPSVIRRSPPAALPGPARPAAPRLLVAAQLASSVGDGAYYVTSALFFVHVIGLSLTQVGSALTIGWGAGLLVGLPLGHLADRLGPRGLAVILAITTAAAIASFTVVHSYPAFIAAACIYGSCQSGLNAARQALLAALISPEKRTTTRARMQAAGNAGLAVGAGLGGIALSVGRPGAYLGVFVLDAASFLVAALALSRLPAVAPSPRPPGRQQQAVLRNRPYVAAAALNAVMLLYMPMLSLVLPLWIVERTAAPRPVIAALFVLNTVGVMALQVQVARRVVDLASAARAIALAGIIMLAACSAFALSGMVNTAVSAVALLAGGAVLQVAAEILLASGSWEISFGLAPADQCGQYQGFFWSGVPVARMIGPLALTSLILLSGRAGWPVLGMLFLLAGVAMVPVIQWAQRAPGAVSLPGVPPESRTHSGAAPARRSTARPSRA